MEKFLLFCKKDYILNKLVYFFIFYFMYIWLFFVISSALFITYLFMGTQNIDNTGQLIAGSIITFMITLLITFVSLGLLVGLGEYGECRRRWELTKDDNKYEKMYNRINKK